MPGSVCRPTHRILCSTRKSGVGVAILKIETIRFLAKPKVIKIDHVVSVVVARS